MNITEEQPTVYKCMVCGQIYAVGKLPTRKFVDGCCTAGSLIEVR
jgi:DNA-directed RNA polymerase subunit RPC12/RpoP